MYSGNNLERKFEKRNLMNVWRSGRLTEAEWNKLSKQFAKELKNYKIKFPDSFTFANNQSFGKKTARMLGEVQGNLHKQVTSQMQKGWIIANKKNNALAAQYLRNVHLKTNEFPSFFNTNMGALTQFVDRTINGMDLSQKIWTYTDEARDILESYVGNGIATGRSAQKIASDVKKCLKNPNRYLTKPGRGVYKSPMANSMRLARTETNMAYRMADHLRYKQLDFVIGIHVHLSGQHPTYDICDSMEGRYPKTFVFLGWHPNCYCYQTSVLASKEDFLRSLRGKPIPATKFVTGMTNVAQQYIKDNISKFASYKTMPYWISKNRKIVQSAINGPILPRAAKSTSYLESEAYWKDKGPVHKAYRPEGYGLDMYNKVMAMDSEQMEIFLKKYNVSRNELYTRISQTRQDLINLKPSKEVWYNAKTDKWNPKRIKDHDAIIEHFLKGKLSQEEPKMLLTGGYPGSGKSSSLDQAFPGWKKRFVHIDSDEIKNMLAKLDGYTEVGWRASAYHEEADTVLKRLMAKAQEQKMDILFDGTMKSFGKMSKMIEEYRALGYSFDMAFVNLPLDKAMERALARYMGKTGRFVDPLYIATHQKENLKTYKKLKREFSKYFDKIVMYDTNVAQGTPAKLIEEISGKAAVKPVPKLTVVKPQAPGIPAYKDVRNVQEFKQAILRDVPSVKSVEVATNISIDNLNRIGKQIYDLERKGFVKSTTREMNLIVEHAEKGTDIGGSYQMFKGGHRGEYRPNLRIVHNWDDMIDDRLTEFKKGPKATLNKARRVRREAVKELANYLDDPGSEMYKYWKTRIDNLDLMLGQPQYTKQGIEAQARDRLRKVVRGQTLEDAITHEYGHILMGDIQGYDAYSTEIRELLGKAKIKYNYRPDNASIIFSPQDNLFDTASSLYARSVSDYAFTNGSEYFAESWLKFNQGELLEDEILQKLFEMLTTL